MIPDHVTVKTGDMASENSPLHQWNTFENILKYKIVYFNILQYYCFQFIFENLTEPKKIYVAVYKMYYGYLGHMQKKANCLTQYCTHAWNTHIYAYIGTSPILKSFWR